MATTLPQNTALILIDIQQGFDEPGWGTRNNPDAEANAARLLRAWRDSQRPIIHVQHLSILPDSPLREGKAGTAFKPEVAPRSDETVITKHVNSAFIGTDLEQRLRDAGIRHVVICGLTTQHCVSTTTRMAGNLGFITYLAADATAAFSATGYDGTMLSAEQVYTVALANLHQEFATVMNTDAVLKLLT